MFHLFTLQGKRIDAQLEHLPKNIRVHHARSNNPVRKFSNGDSSEHYKGESGVSSHGAEAYREAGDTVYEKEPVFHASEIMSSPVFTIGPEVSVSDAWSEFVEKKIHHIPVISEDGKITGIISDRDILKKFLCSDDNNGNVKDLKIREIMSVEVIATAPLTDIRRVAKAMLDHHIGAMPVISEDGSLAGIITRSDILHAVIHHPELRLWA